MAEIKFVIQKSPRIDKLISHLFAKMPEIEADRAELVTDPSGLDEDALRNYFREVAECASGCLFEVAQREVGTIYGPITPSVS